MKPAGCKTCKIWWWTACLQFDVRLQRVQQILSLLQRDKSCFNVISPNEFCSAHSKPATLKGMTHCTDSRVKGSIVAWQKHNMPHNLRKTEIQETLHEKSALFSMRRRNRNELQFAAVTKTHCNRCPHSCHWDVLSLVAPHILRQKRLCFTLTDVLFLIFDLRFTLFSFRVCRRRRRRRLKILTLFGMIGRCPLKCGWKSFLSTHWSAQSLWMTHVNVRTPCRMGFCSTRRGSRAAQKGLNHYYTHKVQIFRGHWILFSLFSFSSRP